VQERRQFLGKISRDRVADERLGGRQQSTVAGEPRRLAGPQAIGSEAGDLTKSVETTAMRVAGQVVELFELSEDGEVDVRAKGMFQIGKGCDFVAEKQLSQGIGAKVSGLIML
jgi:hypothetical protein